MTLFLSSYVVVLKKWQINLKVLNKSGSFNIMTKE